MTQVTIFLALVVMGLLVGIVYFRLLRVSIILALLKKVPMGALPLMRAIRLASIGALVYLVCILEPSGIVAFMAGFVGGRNILLRSATIEITLQDR